MEKQKTVVRVAGKEYALVSSDPPAYMQRVAAYVDRKLSELSAATRQVPGESRKALPPVSSICRGSGTTL